MTNTADLLFVGDTFYNRVQLPSGGGAGENYGQPITPVYAYIPVGATGAAPQASLPSGIITATAGLATAGGTLTMSGTLVAGGVATIDVTRALQITCSSNLSTCIFTFRGTDFYGASMTHSLIGPSGNTLGSAGSFVISTQCFKTVTTASVVGLVTSNTSVGTADTLDLPYRLPHLGFAVGLSMDGQGTATGVPTFVAGQAATTVMLATLGSPRGTVALPTTNLTNGTHFFTIEQILPTWSTTATPTKNGSFQVNANTNSVAQIYGPVPFSN